MRDMVDGVITGERVRLRLLQASTFTSNVDRFAIAPLLVPIGLDLQARSPPWPRWPAATTSPTASRS